MQVNTGTHFESWLKHPDRGIQYKKRELKVGAEILISFKISAESSDTFFCWLGLHKEKMQNADSC